MPDEERDGTEASIGVWLKQLGETVSAHEPLVEISTDKVTIEIAAPAAGVLRELCKAQGEPVFPGDLLGTIETRVDSNTETDVPGKLVEAKSASDHLEFSIDSDRGEAYSPAVRRLLAEHQLDPKAVPKVSRGGRLTPEDVIAYLTRKQLDGLQGSVQPVEENALAGRKVPHSPMRRSIANHMTQSVQTAPHVTSVFEADLFNVLADREARRRMSDGEAVPSITAYLIFAAMKAIKLFPEVNSKWSETYLEVFDHINFGVGTALDAGGLVVPVLRNAHLLDLLTLSQNLSDMTMKARSGKLTQADMEGGTFTLSNHGVSGSLLAAPIILPHGQAAILGAGKMQKRVIVCETGGRELFRVRPMMYVTLTVDHRALDGQQTNGFLTAFVAALENLPEASA
jgi:2-oxoglutarate dehydrogenase E2 component (dihydrolipoamide succinyltransferase)